MRQLFYLWFFGFQIVAGHFAGVYGADAPPIEDDSSTNAARLQPRFTQPQETAPSPPSKPAFTSTTDASVRTNRSPSADTKGIQSTQQATSGTKSGDLGTVRQKTSNKDRPSLTELIALGGIAAIGLAILVVFWWNKRAIESITRAQQSAVLLSEENLTITKEVALLVKALRTTAITNSSEGDGAAKVRELNENLRSAVEQNSLLHKSLETARGEIQRQASEIERCQHEADIQRGKALETAHAAEESRKAAEVALANAKEVLRSAVSAKSELDALRSEFWPSCFLEGKPLSHWREQIEIKLSLRNRVALTLAASLYRYQTVLMADENISFAQCLHDISRCAYRLWKQEGLSTSETTTVAELWGNELSRASQGQVSTRVAHPGEPKDSNWMRYSPSNRPVAEAESWAVLDSRNVVLKFAEVT